MTSQPLRIPETFDNEVRLFPLSDLVLFPGNVLPLHLFESRYREMLEDALRGDELITMATLLPGFEHDYYSRPPIAATVCVGQIMTHEKTEQGTYNLVLAGLQRARVEHEIEPVRAFRRAKVSLIQDCDLDSPSRKLIEDLTHAVRNTLPSARSLLDEFSQQRISLSSLTDVLAFYLPLETDLKLELLAEASVVGRAERLLENWPLVKQRRGGDQRFSADFSQN